MVSHHQMYKGDTVEILSLAKKADFEPIKNLKPDIPEPIQIIIDKALKKNIAIRYQSVDEMMRDIEKCMIDLALRPTAHELVLFLEQISRVPKEQKPKLPEKSAENTTHQH